MSATTTEIDELRRRVAEACRVLGALDITASTFGHASARLPGSDRIFIRARGPAESGVRYTRAEDIIEVDLDGRRVGGPEDGYASPLEVFIHTELYRNRPDVNAVIHAHPPVAVLLTICNTPLLPIFGSFDPNSLALVLEGVPTFPRSTLIHKPERGQELAAFMGASDVCLMKGHGITTTSNSVEEAALLAIQLNTIATMTYQAHMLGDPTTIAQDEQDEFRRLKADASTSYGAAKPGVPSGRATSLWRYYARYAADRAPS